MFERFEANFHVLLIAPFTSFQPWDVLWSRNSLSSRAILTSSSEASRRPQTLANRRCGSGNWRHANDICEVIGYRHVLVVAMTASFAVMSFTSFRSDSRTQARKSIIVIYSKYRRGGGTRGQSTTSPRLRTTTSWGEVGKWTQARWRSGRDARQAV
jgi:hypothetical protein